MSTLNKHWRNKQVEYKNVFLSQEQICLDFLARHQNLVWRWEGLDNMFKNYCSQHYNLANKSANGLIMINLFNCVTPKNFVNRINSLLDPNTQAVYLAINRFTFAAVNDLNIDYADDLTDCLDQIVSHINIPLLRHYTGREIDGRHFVGVHGLDIFTYESSY